MTLSKILAAAALLAAPAAHADTIYNAADLFNTANTGVFTAGSEAALAGPFTPAPVPFNTAPFIGFTGAGGFPAILLNNTAQDFDEDLNGTHINVHAGEFDLHPDSAGDYAVLRFTAPTAGTYSFSGLFEGNDSRPTTTDAYIVVNGLVQDALSIQNYKTVYTLTGSGYALAAGDVIDFAVGYGGNGYAYDSTGLYATVTRQGVAPTPEPATVAPLLIGGLALLGLSRRAKTA